jgi:hypothetical protein
VRLRIGHEQLPAGLEHGGSLREEHRHARHLVDDRESEHEVGASLAVVDAHALPGREAQVEPIGDSRLGRPTAQSIQHLLLDIDGYNTALRSDTPRQLQREVAHSGAGLDDRHAILQERLQDPRCVVPPTPDRVRQQVAHPPRAYSVRH